MDLLDSRLHSIDRLSSIGPAGARRLAAYGLGSVEELVAAGSEAEDRVRDALPQLSAAEASRLLPEAWFILLGGYGARGAAALSLAGFHNYIDLVSAAADDIASTLSALDSAPTIPQCEQLQLSAARAMSMFRVLLTFSNPLGVIEDATLFIAGQTSKDLGASIGVQLGSTHKFLTPQLPRKSSHFVAVEQSGGFYSTSVIAGTTNPVQEQFISFSRPPATLKPDNIRQDAGYVPKSSSNLITLACDGVSKLEPRTIVIVGEEQSSQRYQLTTAVYKRASGLVFEAVVEVGHSSLTAGTKPGDYLVVEADAELDAAPAKQVEDVQRYRQRSGPTRRVSNNG